MKTLYVHIGTAKTGTTAIQKFCEGNREALGRHGYCYPDFSGLCPNFTPSRNGHFLVETVRDDEGKRTKEEEEEIFRKGMEQIAGLFSSYENVVLSDERLWRATYKGKRRSLWERLRDEGERNGYRVKFLVYLRRQDVYLSSYWKQMVKMNTGLGAKLSWEEYFKNTPKFHQLDYYSKLTEMAGQIGKENILVRRYDFKSFLGGSLYADFLDAIGLALSDEFVIEQEMRNLGLTENMCQIKHVLNNIDGMEPDAELFFREVLLDCSGQEEKTRYSLFSKEEAEAFLARYAEGNRRIAEEFLGENGTDLFDMEVADLPKWQADNPSMQDDIIRFAGMCSMRLLDENRRLKDGIEGRRGLLQKSLRTVWHKVRGK